MKKSLKKSFLVKLVGLMTLCSLSLAQTSYNEKRCYNFLNSLKTKKSHVASYLQHLQTVELPSIVSLIIFVYVFISRNSVPL